MKRRGRRYDFGRTKHIFSFVHNSIKYPKCRKVSIFILFFLQIDPKKAERRDGKMFVGGVRPDTTDETVRGNYSINLVLHFIFF